MQVAVYAMCAINHDMNTGAFIEKTVDGLSENPCYLLILAVFVVSAYIIKLGYKHAKEIATINMEHMERIQNGK